VFSWAVSPHFQLRAASSGKAGVASSLLRKIKSFATEELCCPLDRGIIEDSDAERGARICTRNLQNHPNIDKQILYMEHMGHVFFVLMDSWFTVAPKKIENLSCLNLKGW
jgi:hypothetical protein